MARSTSPPDEAPTARTPPAETIPPLSAGRSTPRPHVLEMRRAGLEVGDAPEIMERRKGGKSLREIARSFAAEPPSALPKRSISKYENALRTFAAWAATVNIFEVDQVKDKTIDRWVAHQQKQGLDARTLVTKTRIVLAELRQHGNSIKLSQRTMPRFTERERGIYSPGDLKAFFAACTLP